MLRLARSVLNRPPSWYGPQSEIRSLRLDIRLAPSHDRLACRGLLLGLPPRPLALAAAARAYSVGGGGRQQRDLLGPMSEPAIRLHGVVKRFGSIVAVEGLDLEVAAGICFGLLGPNGAGKSTTMRMLTAQALADEGEISVLSYSLPGQSKQARMEMGVVPQLDNLDVELTCRQILTVFARLYRVPRSEREYLRGSVWHRVVVSSTTARERTRL